MAITGRFAFQMQGFMRARNARWILPTQQEPWNIEHHGGYDSNKDVFVGIADGRVDSARDTEMPVMTAFLPSIFPDGAAPPYTPTTGYYPYAEQGEFFFGVDGEVLAHMQINVGGSAGGVIQELVGSYKMEPPNLFPPFNPYDPPIHGIMTLRRAEVRSPPAPAPVARLDWDYRFTFISTTEALLMGAGRLPRPATLTGRMYFIPEFMRNR